MGATVALLLIPGPAVLFLVNRTLADGRTAGLVAVAGLEVGDMVQATFAALGVSAVLATSVELFNTIKWAGVVYLIYTGIRTLMTRPSSLGSDDSHVSLPQIFRQGIFVNTLNPKTTLFFLSIFPQFIDTNASNAKVQSFMLGVVFVVLATLFNGSYSLMASSLREVLLRGQSVYFVRRYVSGFIFLGLGLLAATTGRPQN